jgi:hypothetical protein
MARLHYHVGVNTVGYLPEGDVYTFSTKGAALAEAKRIRDEILEEGYGPMLPEGSCRQCSDHRSEHANRGKGRCSAPNCTCTRYEPGGVRSSGSDGDYYIGDGNPYHLDAHVWVHPCQSDDCEEEE